MALPVLDGNQSATTLSSVVTGGEHIVAHSVVSLGTTAISNIATAVSGVSVSISGTPSTTFGAVTGSVSILGTPIVTIPGLARLGNSVATAGTADSNLDFIKIGGHQDGQNQVAHIVHVSAGGAMKVDASGSSVTFSQASVTFGAITGSVSILNLPSTQTIAGTVTANLDSNNFNGALTSYVEAVSSHNAFPVEIAYQPSVTIGSLPAISGTVTANVGFSSNVGEAIPDQAVLIGYNTNNFIEAVGENTPLPISGTVTASLGDQLIAPNSFSIAGEDAGGFLPSYGVQVGFVDSAGDFRVVKTSQPLPVSGTVTAAAPNGSLTTRFGTPTTANTAFATAAVTKSDRKYLLIQNVTTGSNVITVGIGFTPTTTQGIQLTAGAGITFESSYIPTGAVYVLSSVTASNFTILEA